MKIRAVTIFANVDETLGAPALSRAGALARAAQEVYPRAGFPVQTIRFATQPLNRFITAPAQLIPFAQRLERVCSSLGLEYKGLGAIQAAAATADLSLLDGLAQVIAATENVFGAVQIATRADGLNLRAVHATAQIIRALTDLTQDGIGNFRFAALANCQPGCPFFPAAFAEGDQPSFSIATEAADLAVQAFTDAHDLADARQRLIGRIEREAAALEKIAQELEERYGFKFNGIDLTLAPGAGPLESIGAAFERLSGNRFGERMSLFASAFVTDCVKRAQFPHVGFCGVFLPILEDSILAARSYDGVYSLDSLLLYSAVCGAGLDNIPLPGDISADALAAILLDLATLAVKLDKPLTARLLPIPGARAGDSTRFNFQWFTNARVLPSQGQLSKEWAAVNQWIGF